VTGASGDDPSGVATYAQAGASHGLNFLWTALLTFPLMAAVQEICDRTALATGVGLGELATKRFRLLGRSVVAVLLVVLIVANTLNVAADLVAIGSGMNLLHAGPTWIWALLAGAAISALLAKNSYAKIEMVFKVLCLSLLVYLVDAVIVTHQWPHLLEKIVVPHIEFNKSYLALFVAILGTTISPYMFFWQSAQRVEEMRDEPQGGTRAVPLGSEGKARARRKERTSRQDVFTGMAFSNIVMFAIIATTAETLHLHHMTHIQSAAQAATALKPFAGRFASAIFALGFIGSGLIAIPSLAASGSVGLSGLFGHQWGFSHSIRQAPVFYGLVAAGTLGGTALSLVHVNPIKLLVLVAIINGVIAAPLLVIVMRVSGSRNIMGKYVNGQLATVLGWFTAALMATAAAAFFATGGLSF
jgi:NRAMP (natural resistance-associated macrophage protein)-like metal ion transporter